MSGDFSEQQQQSPMMPPSPGSSTGSVTAVGPDILDNIDNYSITTEINDSGWEFVKSFPYEIYFLDFKDDIVYFV